MKNRILIGITVMVICVVTLVGCNKMRFNQETNKNNLLTEEYSVIQIEELKKLAETKNVTFSKFKRNFNAQCIRKTYQGYYVVLLLEDSRNAFVFFDEENKLIRVMISDGFKSKEEFQNQVVKQMKKSEVVNFDSNTIFAPVSAIEITAHIVQEGIFIVKYSRFLNGKIIEEPIVTSIEFVENERISTNDDLFIRDGIPFILEIDKECK